MPKKVKFQLTSANHKMQNLWDACLRRLEQELPAQQFNTWIRPLAPEAGAGADTLVLAAPNRFVLELVRERFVARIERLATEAAGRDLGVRLVLARGIDAAAPRAPQPAQHGASEVPTILERGRLNRAFSFDSFVTGKANQLARAAAIQVAENPGISYNPLFIYGGVGLGKTHLLQAIGNQLADQRPQARIRYCHAEQYVTDVVRAYQQKSFDEFKRYYHSLDLLLIDDIQFFIAKHIRSNVRELEGALKKVLAFARFSNRELSLDLAKEALRDILNLNSRQVSVEGIQKTVAEYFKIKVGDMHSKKRSRNLARPRQVAMALAKDLTQMSLPEIGEAFGNRDHTTVLHACRTVASLRKHDTGLNRDYLVLEQVLKG